MSTDVDLKELMSKSINLPPKKALQEMEDKWDYYIKNMNSELINWLYTRIVFLCQVTGETEKEKMYIAQYIDRNNHIFSTYRYFNQRLKIISIM